MHYDQSPRFSNSEFSILYYTQNGKLGVENLGVFLLCIMIKVRGFPTPDFPFCTILKNGKLGVENLGVFYKVYRNNDIFYCGPTKPKK